MMVMKMCHFYNFLLSSLMHCVLTDSQAEFEELIIEFIQMIKEELIKFGRHDFTYRKNIFFFFYCHLKNIMKLENNYYHIINKGIMLDLFNTLLGGVKAGKE